MEDCGVGKLDHNLERNRRVKEVTSNPRPKPPIKADHQNPPGTGDFQRMKTSPCQAFVEPVLTAIPKNKSGKQHSQELITHMYIFLILWWAAKES